jgi:hypothetical protein
LRQPRSCFANGEWIIDAMFVSLEKRDHRCPFVPQCVR